MGLGLVGFIDGIVLHQILQWHHMLTDTGDHPMDTVAGLETNTLADGFFHLATWVFVATAMLLTTTPRARRRSRAEAPSRTARRTRDLRARPRQKVRQKIKPGLFGPMKSRGRAPDPRSHTDAQNGENPANKRAREDSNL
jgi:predicted membrane protein DUF2243